MVEPNDLPPTWDDNGATTPHLQIVDYVRWAYNATAIGLGSAPVSIFDLRVYPFASGAPNSLETGYDSVWSGAFTHRIIDISGTGRGFNSATVPGQEVLIKEILALSYALGPDTPLWEKGDRMFGGSSGPVVDSISVAPEQGKQDVWLMSFKGQRRKYTQGTQSPDNGAATPTMYDPLPWDRRPKVRASFGSEPFQIGTGYFLGTTTPKAVSEAVLANDGSFAAMFIPVYAPLSDPSEFELMVNSAGDPFKSPPKTKVGVTTFEMDVAYETGTDLTVLIGLADSARETMNLEGFAVVINESTLNIKAGTAMMSSFSLTPADFSNQRDWLPKADHPFLRTNEQIGWTGADYVAGAVAVNTFSRTLKSSETQPFTNLKLTFAVKEIGWGTAIPNQGYRSLKTGVLSPNKELDSTKTEELLMDELSIPIAPGDDTYEKQVLRRYSPFGANTALADLVGLLPWGRNDP